MKTIPAALQAHYDTGSTCVAHAMVIRRTDGLELGFTSHDMPFTMDVSPWGYTATALAFDAEQGFDASNIVSSAGFNVDNLELRTLDDGTIYDRDDILAGKWDNARFSIFRYRWDVAAPAIGTDVEPLVFGWFGEVTLNTSTIVIELRSLKQKLQQPVGIVSQKTCRARLGDSRCTKSLASFTHSLTVTGVTDKQTFTCSADAHVADYFGEGLVTFLTGNNAGLTAKVREHATGGVFTLVLPQIMAIQVGDTLTAIAGCRKRLMEDCKTKFDNVLNFQGEPHRPTVDDLTKI